MTDHITTTGRVSGWVPAWTLGWQPEEIAVSFWL